eukprot:TRINITY_DN13214_c0_g1_i1.p1 TRINITY_DN13214_c0_g1~~TRINITY_DN13214_c0_g1_i1.p1  ORF type:complete len:1299 (+),score=263.46 TRINITY_DN13214_c0_g1_i1:85-3981(+)
MLGSMNQLPPCEGDGSRMGAMPPPNSCCTPPQQRQPVQYPPWTPMLPAPLPSAPLHLQGQCAAGVAVQVPPVAARAVHQCMPQYAQPVMPPMVPPQPPPRSNGKHSASSGSLPSGMGSPSLTSPRGPSGHLDPHDPQQHPQQQQPQPHMLPPPGQQYTTFQPLQQRTGSSDGTRSGAQWDESGPAAGGRVTREHLASLIKTAFQLRMVNGRPSRIAVDLPSRRLYWLQTQPTTGRNALFCCDLSPVYEAQEQRRRVHARSDRPTELQLPATVVLPSLPSLASSSTLSREEQLLRERKRVGSYGIAEFVPCFSHRAILLPGDSTVYLLRTTSHRISHPLLYDVLGRSGLAGSVSDTKLAPTAGHLLSFVHQDNIYLCDITAMDDSYIVSPPSGDVDEPLEPRTRRGEPTPGLPIHKLTEAGGNSGFTGCGTADYLTQEEFNRFTGYWWAPVTWPGPGGGRIQRILYIHTDERHVAKVQVSSPDPESQAAEQFAMPRPGEMNMRPSLCILSFPESNPSDVTYYSLPRDELLKHVPWIEYISKAGWTQQGDTFIEVLDRHQERVALLVVPLARFIQVATELDAIAAPVTPEEKQAYRTPRRALHYQALGVEPDPEHQLVTAGSPIVEGDPSCPWGRPTPPPEDCQTDPASQLSRLEAEGGEQPDASDPGVQSASTPHYDAPPPTPSCHPAPGSIPQQQQSSLPPVALPCYAAPPTYPASAPFGVGVGGGPFSIIVGGYPTGYPVSYGLFGMLPGMMPALYTAPADGAYYQQDATQPPIPHQAPQMPQPQSQLQPQHPPPPPQPPGQPPPPRGSQAGLSMQSPAGIEPGRGDTRDQDGLVTGYSVRPALGSGWAPSPSFPYEVIREDVFPDGWVNVADTVYFFNDASGRVIFESEASGPGGYRHLFLYDRKASQVPLQLTKGDWQVDIGGPKGGGGIWVDEANHLVYFSATCDGWTEQHLYYAPLPVLGHPPGSWMPCTRPRRLTDPALTHAQLSVSPDFHLYASCHSSLSTHPTLSVRTCDNTVQATVTPRYTIHHSFRLTTPRLLCLQNKAGVTLQTAFYPPLPVPPPSTVGKVPLVVLVYGGTEVQQVTNDYRLVCQPRLQMLCQLGYACCMIDNQGSSRRGNAFEAVLKHRLGQLEVQDQVDVIGELGRRYPYLDLRRVAIYGWSYGGYIALMSIATRPDFFKMALAGAPVVDWRLYNSAYTERFMGTPLTNPTGYERGRVTEYARHFPNEHDRVVLFHGMSDENVHFCHTETLITALVRHSKPYRLQVYPGERHGLKHSDASFHHEQEWLETVVRFL